MASRAWVLKDPAKHNELLDLLRAAGRLTMHELAERMQLSLGTTRHLVDVLRADGKVGTAIDITKRRTPRSGAPKVAWIVTPSTQRLGKRIKPRPFGFVKPARSEYVHAYAHTGTLTHEAGRIQRLTVHGSEP